MPGYFADQGTRQAADHLLASGRMPQADHSPLAPPEVASEGPGFKQQGGLRMPRNQLPKAGMERQRRLPQGEPPGRRRIGNAVNFNDIAGGSFSRVQDHLTFAQPAGGWRSRATTHWALRHRRRFTRTPADELYHGFAESTAHPLAKPHLP